MLRVSKRKVLRSGNTEIVTEVRTSKGKRLGSFTTEPIVVGAWAVCLILAAVLLGYWALLFGIGAVLLFALCRRLG